MHTYLNPKFLAGFWRLAWKWALTKPDQLISAVDSISEYLGQYLHVCQIIYVVHLL